MPTTGSALTFETPPKAPLRRYELSTTGGCETLMRVIGLIYRRGGEIVSVDFVALRAIGSSARADHPRRGRSVLEVAVAIDPRLASTLLHRLAGLIDVMAVREL